MRKFFILISITVIQTRSLAQDKIMEELFNRNPYSEIEFESQKSEFETWFHMAFPDELLNYEPLLDKSNNRMVESDLQVGESVLIKVVYSVFQNKRIDSMRITRISDTIEVVYFDQQGDSIRDSDMNLISNYGINWLEFREKSGYHRSLNNEIVTALLFKEKDLKRLLKSMEDDPSLAIATTYYWSSNAVDAKGWAKVLKHLGFTSAYSNKYGKEIKRISKNRFLKRIAVATVVFDVAEIIRMRNELGIADSSSMLESDQQSISNWWISLIVALIVTSVFALLQYRRILN